MNCRLSITSLMLLAALTTGCASDDKKQFSGPQAAYESAKTQVNKGNYDVASYDLEQFSSDYPYSKYTVPAELLRIFASYKAKEYSLTETLSSQFIDRHPRHKSVDYAKYMLAMSFYIQRKSEETDPAMNKSAMEAFHRLIQDHPRSEYVKDAKRRLQSLYNTLAKHELAIGKFYFDKDRFVAAANRFQEVVRLYQSSPAIEEALYYLAASYDNMGMLKDANQTARLLKHNYPNSDWTSKASKYL